MGEMCYIKFPKFERVSVRKKGNCFYDLKTLSYCTPKLWTLFPGEIKLKNTITLSKSDVKQWICSKCPCRLCKVFVLNLGLYDIWPLTWYQL